MKENKIKIVPSLLSADYLNLRYEIIKISLEKIDLIHIDIMDGYFTEENNFGQELIRQLKKFDLELIIESHLMISNPKDKIELYINAGTDIVIFHVEKECNEGQERQNLHSPGYIFETIKKARNKAQKKTQEVKIGLAINPSTPVETCIGYINHGSNHSSIDKVVDKILIMSVNPGKGNQKFIKSVLKKVKKLRQDYQYKGDIEIDGGINYETAKQAIEAGVTTLVSGSYIFKGEGNFRRRKISEQIRKLRSLSKY